MRTAAVKIGRATVSLRTGTVTFGDVELRIDSDESMVPTAESTRLTDTSAKVSSSSRRETADSTNERSGVRGLNHAVRLAQPPVTMLPAEAPITNDVVRSQTRALPQVTAEGAFASDVSRALDASVPFVDGVVRIATARARVIGSASSPLTSAFLILAAEFTRDRWAGAGVSARGPAPVVLHRRQAGRRTRSAPLLQRPSRKPLQPSPRVTAPAGPLRQSSRHRPVASPRRQP